MKLFSKNSNLCDHNSPTLQTDRRTDRQTTCDRNTALCTKVHRAVKIKRNCLFFPRQTWKDITAAATVCEHWMREQPQNNGDYCQQSFNSDRSCGSSAVIIRHFSVRCVPDCAFCEITASRQPLCMMCCVLLRAIVAKSHTGTVRQPGLANRVRLDSFVFWIDVKH